MYMQQLCISLLLQLPFFYTNIEKAVREGGGTTCTQTSSQSLISPEYKKQLFVIVVLLSQD